MDSTLVAAIIGVAGALLGVALTRYFDHLDTRTKHQQWLDEFRIPRQLETLSNFHSAIVDLGQQLEFMRAALYKHPKDFDIAKIEAAATQYTKAASLAYIYMPEEAQEQNRHYYRNVSSALYYARAALKSLDTTKIPEQLLNGLTLSVIQIHEYQANLVKLLQQELRATAFAGGTNQKTKHPHIPK